MKFEDLKSVWNSEDNERLFAFDESALLKQLETKRSKIDRKLFWRDSLEIGIGAIIILYWLWKAIYPTIAHDNSLLSNWNYFASAAIIGAVLSVFIIGRKRQSRREEEFDESISGTLRKFISQIDYQITLLRNVVWWYLLPIGLAIVLMVNTGAYGLKTPTQRWVYFGICIVLFAVIYWLNQRAVRTHLIPEKEDLQSLQKTLED